MKKKILAVVLAVVILAVAAVGATLAYLTAKSETIVNTFTLGNVSISLTETPFENKKLIPGTTYAKDPQVTVGATSEDCYVFVKLVEDNGALADDDEGTAGEDETVDALEWEIAAGWTKLENGVYYRKVTDENGDKNKALKVLADDEITVSGGLTQEHINQLQPTADPEDTDPALPSLTITAYAIQSNNLDTAEVEEAAIAAYAWSQVSTLG